MKFSAEEVKLLGAQIALRQDVAFLEPRVFISFYGTNPEVIAECWELLQERELIRGAKPKHLLWTCMYMKLYLPEDVMCALLGVSKPTFKKWVWAMMESLALLSRHVIDWSKRKRNLPQDAVCCVSIDGTDFKTQEPFPFNKKMMSHKFNGAGLKYEIAISVFSGDIVWIYGPHRGGKHDLTIFREQLKRLLEEGEMVEADQGYEGKGAIIRVRHDYKTKKEMKEKERIRARHETCNRRFKCWGILKQEHRHDDAKHCLVFRSVGCITQVTIDLGGCLFGCEPVTRSQKTHSVDKLEF